MGKLPTTHLRRRPRRLNRAAFLFLLVAVLSVGIAKLSEPLTTLRRQQRHLASLDLRQSALLKDNHRLHQHQRSLATEAGQQQAARQKGYLRNGERRVVFMRQPASAQPKQPLPPSPSPR